MTTISCAAVDCKFYGKGNICQAKKINLSEHFVHTVYDGQQQFWRCKTFEKDPEYAAFEEKSMAFFEKAVRR